MIDRSRKIMLTKSLIAGGLAAAIAAASLGATPAAAQGYYGNGYYYGGYAGTPLVGLLPWNWGGTYGGYGWNGGYNGSGGYYVPVTPMMTGRSVAMEMPGDYCSTPIKTCLLTQTSFVGNGCSCRVAPGRSRGEVVR